VTQFRFTRQTEAGLPDSELAPDLIQQQVAQAVGTIPGLSELFVSQLHNGGYMVHATVELSGDDALAPAPNQFNRIGLSYMNQVYSLKLPIQSAEIFIVQNNRMVFGMGVGEKYKNLFTSLPVNAGDDQNTQVVQTIQRIDNQDESHPDQMAWIETLQ
jgi:hypothetical protein